MHATRRRSQAFATMAGSEIRRILALTESTDVLSLAGGIPNPATFPVDDVADATARVLRARPEVALQYATTAGLGDLRAVVASLESDRRASTVPADGVLITTGSQQALDLLARCCIDPGDVVAVDAPGYLGALGAIGQRQPTWLPVAVDGDGIDTDALAEHLADGVDVRVVYTATDFQNPTGAVLSQRRRQHLAELADRHDLLVIEDDPYGALRFDAPALPPVATYTDRAVVLGSSSKSISAGLRVGWLVGSPALVDDLVRAKQTVDLNTSALAQCILADLLTQPGWLDARSARLGAFYGERATTLVGALHGHGIPVRRPRGGLFCWADLGVDTAALLDTAIAAGVAYVPEAAFRTSPDVYTGARLSFATLDDDGLRAAAGRLAGVLGP